ncbi:hypothetical protein [Streptomyces sp. NPDC026092]|uniref:hypothetical protein n=1 Tax=Streptomyces sp. NPDC026092 TaxID=3154797 RepID=UPI0033F33A3C
MTGTPGSGSTPTSGPDATSTPAPGSPDATDGRGSRARLGEVAALVSAVTAVLGLILGFFGLPVVFNSPTARTVTETVYVTRTVTVPAAPEAPATAAPSTAPTPSASGGPGPGADGGARTQTVEIGSDYGIRLDENPLQVRPYEEGVDFYSLPEDFQNGEEGTRLVVLRSGESGSLATCKSVTRFEYRLDLVTLRAGAGLCLYNAQGTIAYAEVVSNSFKSRRDSGFLKLKITVWSAR